MKSKAVNYDLFQAQFSSFSSTRVFLVREKGQKAICPFTIMCFHGAQLNIY